MALLPFHLQFTVSSRSEIWRWSLGLLIPLDPQKNTWCSYELLSVLFQLWVFAKALKPKIKCPQAGGQQEVLELWAGQRSPTPTWPRALLGCHESQRWWTAPNLLLSSDPNFLVTNTGLPGNAGLKGRVPGQTVTLIHCRLRKMLNFFGFQVLSKIRLGHDLHKYPLWLWRSHVVISVCASHELRTKTGPGWPGLEGAALPHCSLEMGRRAALTAASRVSGGFSSGFVGSEGLPWWQRKNHSSWRTTGRLCQRRQETWMIRAAGSRKPLQVCRIVWLHWALLLSVLRKRTQLTNKTNDNQSVQLLTTYTQSPCRSVHRQALM